MSVHTNKDTDSKQSRNKQKNINNISKDTNSHQFSETQHLMESRNDAIQMKTLQNAFSEKNSLQNNFKSSFENSFQNQQTAQLQSILSTSKENIKTDSKPNNKTGLPEQLRSGLEQLSGYSMNGVNVHYNSYKPAQLKAHAFAQGNDIHLASGQEKHLPHEAWHVVQQKQRRVQATKQLKGKININDNKGLEQEADRMGEKALQLGSNGNYSNPNALMQTTGPTPYQQPIQRKEETDLKTGVLNMIGETHTDYDNNADSRKYEAKQIKAKLGSSVEYYTESILKAKSTDKDFGDPIDQRMEQAIAFVKEDVDSSLKEVKAVDLVKLALEVQAKKQPKIDAKKFVTAQSSVITGGSFDKAIFDKALRKEGLSILQLEMLQDYAFWDCGTHDPSGNFDTEYDEVFEYVDKLKDELELAQQSSSSVVVPTTLTESQKASGAIGKFYGFYTKLDSRLKNSLKMFAKLKSDGHYSSLAGYFDYDVTKMGDAIKAWDDISTFASPAMEVFTSNKYDKYVKTVKDAKTTLEGFITAIDAGMSSTNDNVEDVKVKRSKSMHATAEKLKTKNIAWKVGNLHVEDIKKLEGDSSITTSYAYITKDNFKSKNIVQSDMDSYTAVGGEIQASFEATKQEQLKLKREGGKLI